MIKTTGYVLSAFTGITLGSLDLQLIFQKMGGLVIELCQELPLDWWIGLGLLLALLSCKAMLLLVTDTEDA